MMEAVKILDSAIQSQKNDLITVEATVATGFEFLAMDECKESCQPYGASKSKGRIFFNVPLKDIKKVYSLRAVDNVYLLCHAVPDINFQNEKEKDIETVKNVVEAVDWKTSLEKWAEIKSFSGLLFPSPEELGADNIVKFRVTCHRAGRHSFTSMDAAREFGGLLNDKFNWKVDLTNFDLEVVLNITDSTAYVGAALTRESLHRRNMTHLSATTLRATLCYCLVRLAEPASGEIVFDPLCGTGSIPIESSIGFPRTYNLGGDKNEKSIIKARKNMVAMGGKWVKLFKVADSAKDVAEECGAEKGSGKEVSADEVGETGDGLKSVEEEPRGRDSEEEVKERGEGDASRATWAPSRPALPADILLWSIRHLPLRDSSIDVFVTDLPFGKRSGRKQDNRKFYNMVLREAARVVRPKCGRASILTADKIAMNQALNTNSHLWKQIRTFNINQGGLTASVYLLLRSAKPFVR